MSLKRLYLGIIVMTQMLREKNGLPILIRPVRLIPVNGLVDSETVLEYKSGLMELNMKDSGKITELTEEVNSLMSMVTFMMATGLMIKRMASEFTFM